MALLISAALAVALAVRVLRRPLTLSVQGLVSVAALVGVAVATVLAGTA